MVKLGMIGFSPDNGHPYSFSAIINGYSKQAFLKTEWIGILNYLEKRDESEFQALDARVTHVWTQDRDLSQSIADCCYVDSIVDEYVDMIGQVDAVVIARDDFESHVEIARPFLVKGIPVMIDKPLVLDRESLTWFKSFWDQGLVYSTSGMRYCSELDLLRDADLDLGEIKYINASVVNQWEKYGVHMLDAVLGFRDKDAKSISCQSFGEIDRYTLEFEDGLLVCIDTLGSHLFSFGLEVIGTKGSERVNLRDNFSAFKRMLSEFIQQVQSGQPSLNFESVNRSISILISGNEAKKSQSKIEVIYE